MLVFFYSLNTKGETISKREYGDYQTPKYFSDSVCNLLEEKYHLNPSIIIEPTCGIGNFLESSFCFNAKKFIGVEINTEYCKICRENFKQKDVEILNENILNVSFKNKVSENDEVLVIGNPPWILNSNLSTVSSDYIPSKSNFKNLNGIESITGSGTFDICENIILKLIQEFESYDTTISLLCKLSTVRNVFLFLKTNQYHFSIFDIYQFDAKRVFNVNTSSCLMILKLTNSPITKNEYTVFDFDNQKILETCEFHNKTLRIKTTENVDLDGKCCFEWRQGVKHDCCRVMELERKESRFYNKWGELVDIEEALVYPLVKTSQIKKALIDTFDKYVILTQKRLNQETDFIKTDCPKLWRYLNENKSCFLKRKSRVYKGKPPFSIFGIGEYAFSKYKVAVSGFNKVPLFSLLVSNENKPVMLDDTCYYLKFDEFNNAYTTMLILNSNIVQNFLKNITFSDSKRPFTKRVLERIDFTKILDKITLTELKAVEDRHNLCPRITQKDVNDFKVLVGKFSEDSQLSFLKN